MGMHPNNQSLKIFQRHVINCDILLLLLPESFQQQIRQTSGKNIRKL